MKLKTSTSIALVAALLLAACAPDQITASLELAVDAASVAWPIVAAESNLSPETVTKISAYLADVNAAAIATTAILADKNTSPAQKAALVTGAFASIAVPDLPAGTPQQVSSVIKAVSVAVADVLSRVHATSAEVQFARPELASGFAAKEKPAQASGRKLETIRAKARANIQKLRARK